MKYISEFRDADLMAQYLEEIRHTVTRPWTIMEVCGGQTHSLVKNGILNLCRWCTVRAALFVLPPSI
jgi:hydrogenase expression/formation protein HypD